MRASQNYTMQKIQLASTKHPREFSTFVLFLSRSSKSCLSFILSTSEATFSTQPRGIPIVSAKKEEGVDER